MDKRNESKMIDSGYVSTLKSSSFSFPQLTASTPKKDNKNSTFFSQQNCGISNNKSANGFKSLDGDIISAKQKEIDYQKKNVLNYKHFALIFFAIFVISYKMVLVAMPYTNTESFYEASTYAQEKFTRIVDWAQENELSKKLTPLFCGLAISLFSYMIVYMDSCVPGVNPPTPFGSKEKAVYGRQRSSRMNINYMTAIASGFVVAGLMWFGPEN